MVAMAQASDPALAQYIPDRTDLFGPNVCCSFKLQDVLASGFLTQFGQYMKAIAVQHYKDNACVNAPPPAAGLPPPVFLTPAQAFSTYQTHSSAQNFFNAYVNASLQVAAAGKDLVSE